MFLRFSRYRFKDGNETEGLEHLRRQASAMRAAEGCEGVWVGQGQHPSTEFIVVTHFRDHPSLRAYEAGLRSDPNQGGAFFSLLRLTTQPPEITEYELLEPGT